MIRHGGTGKVGGSKGNWSVSRDANSYSNNGVTIKNYYNTDWGRYNDRARSVGSYLKNTVTTAFCDDIQNDLLRYQFANSVVNTIRKSMRYGTSFYGSGSEDFGQYDPSRRATPVNDMIDGARDIYGKAGTIKDKGIGDRSIETMGIFDLSISEILDRPNRDNDKKITNVKDTVLGKTLFKINETKYLHYIRIKNICNEKIQIIDSIELDDIIK